MLAEIRAELVFLTAFLVAIIILPKLAFVAQRFKLVDLPGGRKVHSKAAPLVGGIGMLMALLAACFLLVPLDGMAGFLAGLLLLGAVGVVDDARDLGSSLKFIAQIVAVLLMFFLSDTSLTTFGNLVALGELLIHSAWLYVPVTVFCAVGLINAFNMIDGLDGLAGGLSFIAFISFSIISFLDGHPQLALFSVAYAGAILGFLRYNWRPARLFMGDAGSLMIGFSLMYVALATSQEPDSLVRPVSALLILGIPICDTLTLMTRRLLAGRSPVVADKFHLHHILLRYGFSKKAAVKIILSLAMLGAAAAIVGVVFRIPDYFQFLFFMMMFVVYFAASFLIKDMMKILLRLGRRRAWYGHNSITRLLLKLINTTDVFGVFRSVLRQDVDLVVECLIIENDCPERSFKGKVLNISKSGFMASLPTMNFLRGSMLVRISFPAGDEVQTFSSMAENIWFNKGTGCYHGFRFTETDSSQIELLNSSLARIETYSVSRN